MKLIGRENTEQTEITEQTEKSQKTFPFVPLFPSVPYSQHGAKVKTTAPMTNQISANSSP